MLYRGCAVAQFLVLRQAAQFCFSAGLAAPFLRRPTTMLSGANTPPNTRELSRKNTPGKHPKETHQTPIFVIKIAWKAE